MTSTNFEQGAVSLACVHVHCDASGVAWITLDNPAKMNAMNLAMWQSLADALARLQADASVRCCVLTGEGDKAFCTGADIGQMDAMRGGADASAEYDRITKHTLARLHAFDKPIVAMVSGYCMGAGVALAAACDLRFAAEGARFAIPSAKLGIAYYHQGVKRLTELMGPANTARLLFTGERFNAEEMLRRGLLDEVLPQEQLAQRVLALASAIAANAPLSIAAAKFAIRAANGCEEAGIAAQLAAHEQACASSEDHAEGRRAFLEKRAPVFQGQ
jgi:enoyl-CoA hydratase